MKYDNLSKAELLSKIEILEQDLIKSNSFNKKLEKAEDIASQQSSILDFINSMAIPSADKSSVDEFSKTLLKAVKDYTGAILAVFSLYLPDKKELLLLHFVAEQGILKTFVKIAGEKIINTASPVNDETYKLMIKNPVGTFNTFTEVSFGAVPKLVDKAIRASTGIERLYPVVHVIEGELYGTTLLAFKKEQTSPSIELLESYAHLMSVSLRRYNAEKALQDSEIKHRTYIEHAPLGVIIANDKGKYIDVNPGATELLGYTRDELLELSVPDVLANKKDIDSFQKLKKEGKLSHEIELKKKDGAVVNVRLDAVLLPNNQFIAFHTDITEHKKAEDALKESKEKFEETANLMPQIIFESDLKGNLTYVNKNAHTIFGYPEDYPMLGKSALDLFTPESKLKGIENISQKVASNNGNVSNEYEMVRKDGSTFPALVYSTPIEKEDKPIGMRGIIIDITELKKAQEEIKKIGQHYQALIEKAPDGVVLLNAEGNFKYISPSAKKMFGYHLTDETSANPAEYTHPDDLPMVLTELGKILEDPDYVPTLEYRFINKQGKWRWVETTFSNLLANPSVESIVLNFRDITERKLVEIELIKAKQKAEENEIKFKAAFYTSPDAVNINKMDGEFVEINEGFTRLTGYTEDEVIGKRSSEIDIWPIPEERNKLISALQEFGYIENLENNFKTKDGRLIPALMSAKIITIKDEPHILSVTKNISELKKFEQELITAKEIAEESEQRLKLASSSAELGIWDWNVKENTMVWDERMFQLYGITEETFANTIEAWLNGLHPDDKERAIAESNKALAGDKQFNTEFRVLHPDGKVKYIKGDGLVLRGSNGEAIRMIGVNRDITEKKLNELEIVKAKEKAEKNEEKFRLLYRLNSEMLLLQDVNSIYKFIAENLQKHIPNTIVLYNTIDEFAKQTKLEVVSGIEKSLLQKIASISGVNPIGKTYNLSTIHNNYFKSGNFVEFEGGLTKFSGSEFPAFATNAIEKLIGIHKIYTIGINKDDQLFAGIHFFTFNKQVITDSSFIEVFVKQAGLVLQKKINEKALTIAREKAEETKANITAIIEGTKNSIWAFDKNYELLYINKTFQQEFLKSFNVLLKPGMNLAEALPESLQPFWKTRYDRVLNNEQYTIEDAVPTENGTLYIEVTFNPIVKNGQVIGGSCFGSDITERKKSELQLRKTLQEQNLILENDPAFMIFKDTENNIIRITDTVAKMTGLPKEQIEGRPSKDVYPDMSDTYYTDDLEVMQSGKPKKGIIEPLTAMDGSIKWLLTDKIPYYNTNNEIAGILVFSTDITELKKYEETLVKAKEKAEESDRLKSAFLANMSHEIRTPMNGILGFTNLLKEPELTGEDQQKFIDIIEKSGNRMLNTVNDIIDISKIESGQVDVMISVINMNKQLDELFEFFLPEAKKKSLQLSITNRLPDQLAKFKSDKEKLNSILTNFIKNAIKYTPAGSIEFGYTIKESDKQNKLEFYVKDTGIGIPKERQNAIFNRFEQADIEDRQVFEGSGLGLAIAKAYVEMLGGKIWVESEEGVGSQFYFTIPYENKD